MSINEDSCAVCGLRQHAASNLTDNTFQVNTTQKCGHKFCDRCVERELHRKRQFLCPLCNVMVTREKLSKKSLDETEVERDFKVRRRIKSIYNKTEDQFDTLLDFNNYQEMVEDIIFNILHGIDEDLMEMNIKNYEQLNLKIIAENQSRKSDEHQLEEQKIRFEEEQRKVRILEMQKALINDKQMRYEHSKQLDELLLGERDEVTVKMSSAANLVSNQLNQTQDIQTVVNHQPNSVVIFLNQRAEPKVISMQLVQLTTTQVDKTLIATAGGYIHNHFMARNWFEVTSALSVSSQRVGCPVTEGDGQQLGHNAWEQPVY